MEQRIELGDVAKDTITGFEGIVVGDYKYLHGCRRLSLLSPDLHEGKPIDAQVFDEPQLELVKKAAAATTDDKGGPRDDPKRPSPPAR